jgi:Na+:H+ antiporter, NhaA family
MQSRRRPNLHRANRIARAFARRFGGESGAGLLLIGAAAAATVLANSPLAEAYHHWFHAALPFAPIARLPSLHAWINDAAMAVFFFVVGLEIKREVLDGELSTPARRRLPVLAALAGMAAPALVYWLLARGDPALLRGWAIPAATDIAFALGVLALVGKGLPGSLRLFLLSVAIVDDLGAALVIALFYSGGIDLGWLAGAGAALAAMALLNRAGVGLARWYVIGALAVWFCVLHSGVHPTIGGVAAAMTVPLAIDKVHYDSVLLRLEHALTPWSAYAIVPLFGFANAGVSMAGIGPGTLLAPLPLAVALGLVIGKQAGIFAAIYLSAKSGFAAPPAGATWRQLWGVSALCGIGFTMSLFIAALAFGRSPELFEEAKLGVLAGTLLSVLAGAAILRGARVE